MSSSFPGPSLSARVRVSARTSAWVLSLALLTSLLGACSPASEDDESPVRSQPRITASHVGVSVPAVSLQTTTALGRLVGRLPGPRRQVVRRQVTAVIDRWWEAAYLPGEVTETETPDLTDPPDRTSRAAAFPGFTLGARARAVADRGLMTNAELDATAVTPLMRKVHLDLLAVNGRTRAVTARFDLRLRVAGSSTHPDPRRMQVRGRLFLTHGPRGWKIFGYDVSKGWL